MNRRMKCVAFISFATLSAFSALAETNAWPFAILRNWGTYEDNRTFIGRAFAAQERHPGLIDEIWFCGGGDPFADPEVFGKSVADGNLGARAECRRLGISFAYQQGVTLNHGWDDIRRDGFPEDAWVVDDAGKTRYGLFCCTSPFVHAYSLRKAKAILDGLRPDAYWPDDDMRLYKVDWSRPSICFCGRCIGLYNRRYGRNLDRVGLLAKLNGPEASADVRREWCAFNGTVLGEYAKVYRAAADAVCPGVRMGAQIALSGNAYDGRSWEGLIRSFAGRTGETGIRPGGIYYEDFHPHSLLEKAIGVAREAARSSRLAETAQVCYEAENWPHIGAQKSPGGMMSECALALASGCDSLALYWGSDLNAESEASYDFWFETFAAWKPFLLGVRDAFRGTRLGGVACFHGADHFATPEWINHDEPAMTHLACNALPVTVTEAEPDALFLNERSVRTLAESDLPTVFARPVLTDAEAFAALKRRFPALGFVRKVELRDFAELKSTVTGDRGRCYERFRVYGQCGNVKSLIYPKADDVIALSEMTFDPKTCGTCVVPTEFGGRVVVMQGVPGAYPQLAWSGSRRHGVLDALDLVVPGGMPARLLTDGYACSVSVRKTADGRTAGALILNLGTGETPPLELAIRRGAADAWQIRLPKRDACAAEVVRTDGRETVLRMPPLPAFGVALVEAIGRANGLSN